MPKWSFHQTNTYCTLFSKELFLAFHWILVWNVQSNHTRITWKNLSTEARTTFTQRRTIWSQSGGVARPCWHDHFFGSRCFQFQLHGMLCYWNNGFLKLCYNKASAGQFKLLAATATVPWQQWIVRGLPWSLWSWKAFESYEHGASKHDYRRPFWRATRHFHVHGILCGGSRDVVQSRDERSMSG